MFNIWRSGLIETSNYLRPNYLNLEWRLGFILKKHCNDVSVNATISGDSQFGLKADFTFSLGSR